jgi:hypothetical protein
MRLSMAAAALLWSGTIHGFTLPPHDAHKENGVYIIHELPTGEKSHIKVANLTDESPSPSHLQHRSVNWQGQAQAWCDDNNFLSSADLWNQAKHSLSHWCGSSDHQLKAPYNKFSAAYAISGNALAYFCAYDTSNVPSGGVGKRDCEQDQLLEAFQWIVSVCQGGTNGWQKAGMCFALPYRLLSIYKDE